MTVLNSDCLGLIFNELQTEKNSLYSCLLVNRQWCNAVVSILWKKYSWCIKKIKLEKKLFKTILSCLSSSSKQFLYDNNIILTPTIFIKPPLFNYISFCNFPETDVVRKIIEMVLGKFNYDKRRKLLEQEIYKLFVIQCKYIKELYLRTSQPLSLFPGASTCFSQLHSLRINMDSVNSDHLHGMAQHCKDLDTLSIYNCSKDFPGLISLIDAQRNLKGLYLYTTKEEIKELQKYLSNSEFPNLKVLGITGLSCFKELAMLIEKTKGNISRVYIYTKNKTAKDTGTLIKSIANNCPKIKFLRTYLEPEDFIHIKSLLLNCKHLEKLRFDNMKFFINENNNNIGDELLDIFTEFSPKSLINITISEDWKYSVNALERFFESCRKRTLFDFEIIHHDRSYITETHRAIVRKYINEGVITRSNCIESRTAGFESFLNLIHLFQFIRP